MRECFKYNDKSIIEFCLQDKLKGVSFDEAAKKLGYQK
jgi:hypothetical protein